MAITVHFAAFAKDLQPAESATGEDLRKYARSIAELSKVESLFLNEAESRELNGAVESLRTLGAERDHLPHLGGNAAPSPPTLTKGLMCVTTLDPGHRWLPAALLASQIRSLGLQRSGAKKIRELTQFLCQHAELTPGTPASLLIAGYGEYLANRRPEPTAAERLAAGKLGELASFAASCIKTARRRAPSTAVNPPTPVVSPLATPHPLVKIPTPDVSDYRAKLLKRIARRLNCRVDPVNEEDDDEELILNEYSDLTSDNVIALEADEAKEALKGGRPSLVFESWLAKHCTKIHLSGALMPGSDRCYSKSDALWILSQALTVARNKDLEPRIRIAATGYLVSSLSSKRRRAVLAAIAELCSSSPRTDLNGWLSRTYFTTKVPNAKGFGQTHKLKKKYFDHVETTFPAPLPKPITTLLDEFSRLDPSIWESNSELEWDAAFQKVKSEFLEDGTRTFSEEKIQHILPVAVWMTTFDIVHCQFLASDALDHSLGPLHYFAIPSKDLLKSYSGALKDWFPVDLAALPAFVGLPNQLIGAPDAAIKDSHAYSAIKAFRNRVSKAIRLKNKSIRDEFEALKLLTVWTCVLFSAATSHRLTEYINDLSLRDLVLFLPGIDGGLSIYMDKPLDSGLFFRAGGLPPMVRDQITFLLSFKRRLAIRLRKFKGPMASLATELEKSVAGELPLFQLPREQRHNDAINFELIPVNRHELEAVWTEWDLPVKLLRNRFPILARNAHLAPDDVRKLMGHSQIYEAFGEGDPDSPIALVKRTNPKLNSALKMDGWDYVGSDPQSDASEIDDLGLDASSIYQHDLNLQSHHRALTSIDVAIAGKQEKLSKEAIHDLINAAIESEVPTFASKAPPRQIQIAQDQVERMVERFKGAFESRELMILGMQRFRRFLESLIKNFDWALPLPVVPSHNPPDFPIITPTCTQSWDWVKKALIIAEYQLSLDWGNSNSTCTPTVKAAIAVTLAARSGLVTRDRLLAVVQAIGSSALLDLEAASVGIEYAEPLLNSTSSHSPEDFEDDLPVKEPHTNKSLFIVHGVTAHIALRARSFADNFSKTTQNELTQGLRHLFPRDLIGADLLDRSDLIDTILDVIRHSRRLSQPGIRSAWEDLRILSVSLDARREFALRFNKLAVGDSTDVIADPSPVPDRPMSKYLEFPYSFLRALRREFHETQVKKKTTKKVAIGFLTERLSSHTCPQILDRVAVAYMIQNIESSKGSPASAYAQLLHILEPLIESLNSRPIESLDSVDLAYVYIRAIKSCPRRSQKTTTQSMNRFMKVLKDATGQIMSDSELEDFEIDQFEAAPPYLITNIEQLSAKQMLRHWAEIVSTAGSTGSFRSIEFVAAENLISLPFRGSLRTKEALDRKTDDLLNWPSAPIINVRARRNRKLKRPHSARHAPIHCHMTADEFSALSRLRGINETALAMGISTDLFDLNLNRSLETQGRRLVSIAAQALNRCTDPLSARPYAGRHAYANAGFFWIMSRAHANCLMKYEGLQQLEALKPFASAPLSIQLHALARLMGHVISKTTLRHYCHLFGFLILPEYLPEPTGQRLADISAQSYGAARTAASRSGRSITDFTSGHYLSIWHKSTSADFKERIDPLQKDLPRDPKKRVSDFYSHLRLGTVLHDLELGFKPLDVEGRRGLPAGYVGDLIRRRDALMSHYRYSLGTRVLKRHSGTQAAEEQTVSHTSRSRRFEPFRQLLKRCDQLAAKDPSSWSHFCDFIRLQKAFTGTLVMRPEETIRVTATLSALSAGLFTLAQVSVNDTHGISFELRSHASTSGAYDNVSMIRLCQVCLLAEMTATRH